MRVLVLGAGRMGAQIGCEYVCGGHDVTFAARDLDAAAARVEEALALASRLGLEPRGTWAVAPGADVESVRNRLKANLSDVDVLTAAEFRDRSRSFWLFGTGAGFALFAGALLGMIVGTVIVAQTLYSSTKDHINEFATLRAIGSSGIYIHKVIICQALISAVIGFCLAAGIGLLVVAATADTALPIVMTPTLTLVLLFLTLVMCVVSAVAAILQVMRIDPVMVFTR